MLCDNLERVNAAGNGKEGQEGTYVYLWLTHIDVWQKPTQHCKALILQLKRKKKELRVQAIRRKTVTDFL